MRRMSTRILRWTRLRWRTSRAGNRQGGGRLSGRPFLCDVEGGGMGVRGRGGKLTKSNVLALSALICMGTTCLMAQQENAFHPSGSHDAWEFGALVQGGTGLTEERGGLKFLMAGAHGGKVLTSDHLPGVLRGNFEYAVEVFPFWQSYTPKFQRANCVAAPSEPAGVQCSPLYTVGGTFSGLSITPIILRWNFAQRGGFAPWMQGAGGVLWTNHKYPAFGSSTLTLSNDGPATDASVWNFTPQAGVGLHYFVGTRRSIDFGTNAVHVSSASLGDRNPGVNASVQFSLGYSWWR